MNRRLTIAVVLLATSWAVASKDLSLQELEAKAEAARPEDRPQLYVEIAERQLGAASESYKTGEVEKAREAVNDIVLYSGKARDASIQSGKKLKNTEISVRKMALKLRDLRRTLNFEEQASVEAAADQLESIRSELLAHMFSKAKR